MKSFLPYALGSTLLLCTSCSAIKYLPAGDYFYDDARIKINGPENKETEAVTNLLEEIPLKGNSVFLGSRPAVWSYSVAGEPKKWAIHKQILKNTLGEKPVFLSQAHPEVTAKILAGKLYNTGYFKSKVGYEIRKDDKKRKSEVIYTVTLPRPYLLKSVRYGIDDTLYTPLLETLFATSLVRTGQQYNLETLQEELRRIEKAFKNKGLFYFTSRYLIFEADSSGNGRGVDLTLQFETSPPGKARTTYALNKSIVYCDNPFQADSARADTLSTADVDVIYDREKSKNLLKPEFLSTLIALKRGETYSMTESETTRRLFMSINLLDYMNIRYTANAADSTVLDPHIYLNFRRKKSFSSDMKLISKSNGTIGPAVTLSLSNRNFFRGADHFDVSISGAYETQLSNESASTLNAFEVKLESSLTIRRLLLPFNVKQHNRKYLPTTTFKSSVNFQNRINYYDISAFNASMGYNWRRSEKASHEFLPVDLSYVKTNQISDDFYDLLLLNPSLAISLQDQFIIATRFTYTFRNQSETPASFTLFDQEKEVNPRSFFFRGTVEQAGNLTEAVMSRTQEGAERPFQILGSPYAQYMKVDTDFRYSWNIDTRQKIATNLVMATGYAYGNAVSLPYIKQYSIGGASSIRAFPARTVGPGSYNRENDERFSEDSISFTDQYADIKLQGNIEYRFDIFKILKGAVFADAGNIWTIREDTARVGSQFKPGEFYKQLAVGAGIGLRLSLGVFVLRFDTAVPFRRPDAGWVFDDMEWTSAWRRENIIFTIAVGYPF
jgi:outer membrane protein insertion porin family